MVLKKSDKNKVTGFGELAKCPPVNYSACMSPWQSSKYTNRLSIIQRKAVCLGLGLPGTAGTESVEVAAGIPPLDLHFRQACIRELAKIQAKSIRQRIRVLLNNMTETDHPGNITPRHLTDQTGSNICQRYGERDLMEEEPKYMKGALGCQRVHHSMIQYWSRLGSSKSRTSGQREQGK